MKLENNEIIFEENLCWSCDGKGERTYGISCPNMWKVVGVGKKCSCGAKNKNSHTLIGEELKQCNFCHGTGKLKEDKCSNLPKEIFAQIPIKFGEKIRNHTDVIKENLFGMGIVGGATDYGAMRDRKQQMSESELIEHIRKDWSPRQVYGFLNDKGEFAKELLVTIRQHDYSIYAVW